MTAPTPRALELAAIAALTAFTAAAPLAAQFTAEGEDVAPLEELLDPPRSELDALVVVSPPTGTGSCAAGISSRPHVGPA